MNESDFKLAIRLAAIEYVLSDTLARLIPVIAGSSSAATYAQALRAVAHRRLEVQTFPGAEPTSADHAAAELQSEVDRLLAGVVEILAKTAPPS
jgi:hypothetical protein